MSVAADDYRIAKLELKPGDILVCKLNERCDNEMAVRLYDKFKAIIPDVTVIVLDSAIDLSVLTKQEIESRTKDL